MVFMNYYYFFANARLGTMGAMSLGLMMYMYSRVTTLIRHLSGTVLVMGPSFCRNYYSMFRMVPMTVGLFKEREL